MRPVKTHSFRGKRFTIDLDPDMAGCCDHPEGKGLPSIIVLSDMDTKQGLEHLIHESLHACRWSKHEEDVHETADDIARLLWRLGFRRTVND